MESVEIFNTLRVAVDSLEKRIKQLNQENEAMSHRIEILKQENDAYREMLQTKEAV